MRKTFFLLAILAVICWIIPFTMAQSISIDPLEVESPDEGGQFTIEVTAKDVEDLYGFQFDLKFDKDALKVAEVEEGDFLKQNETQTAIGALKEAGEDEQALLKISNDDGSVEVKNTRLAVPEGVSATGDETGTLVTITFEVLQKVESDITLENVSFADSTEVQFPEVTIVNGKVIVTPICVTCDVNGDGRVRANDALLTLRIAVGLDTPTPEQECAADANGDGKIRANDALLCLRKAVGLDTAPALVSHPIMPLKVSLSNVQGILGNEIQVSLAVDNPQIVGGTDVTIGYDSTVLTATNVESDNDDAQLAANINTPGVIRISTANPNIFTQPVLATIHFKVVQDSKSALELRNVEFFGPNALPINATRINGEFISPLMKPDRYLLRQNFPNPFNPETWIPYQLKESSDVVIRIYDISGRLIRTFDLGYQTAGIYTTNTRAAYWDGRNNAGESVASGTYFYTLKAKSFMQTRRMLLVK